MIRGGVNIAPLEIDEILIKHPGIAEAAAVGVPDKIYGEEVVAYVVPKDKALTEAMVLEHAGKFLPPAKTPKQVLFVTELPKSDRGKVVRDRLREDLGRRGKRSVVAGVTVRATPLAIRRTSSATNCDSHLLRRFTFSRYSPSNSASGNECVDGRFISVSAQAFSRGYFSIWPIGLMRSRKK